MSSSSWCRVLVPNEKDVRADPSVLPGDGVASSASTKFSLMAVIAHEGTLSQGHYTSYVRGSDDVSLRVHGPLRLSAGSDSSDLVVGCAPPAVLCDRRRQGPTGLDWGGPRCQGLPRRVLATLIESSLPRRGRRPASCSSPSPPGLTSFLGQSYALCAVPLHRGPLGRTPYDLPPLVTFLLVSNLLTFHLALPSKTPSTPLFFLSRPRYALIASCIPCRLDRSVDRVLPDWPRERGEKKVASSSAAGSYDLRKDARNFERGETVCKLMRCI